MRHSKATMRSYFKALGLILCILTVGLVSVSFADSTPTLKEVSTNIDTSVGLLGVILVDLALIAGIGFVMASFFKLHQHKLNPTQVPISQGITLMLIGAGLMLIPYLVPLAAQTLLGNKVKTATTSGKEIQKLLTGSGS